MRKGRMVREIYQKFTNRGFLALGVLSLFCISFTSKHIAKNKPTYFVSTEIGDPQDSFPIPMGNPKQLFYLQRTTNKNTIVCELNLNSKGQPDEENPVSVFWIRYAENGAKKELNYIQRAFAYGIKSHPQGNGTYKLNFVSYKKQALFLMPSLKDNKYHVFATINKKQAILNRLFIKIDGGSFWAPNIVYMELKGTDLATGNEVMERLKP